MSSVWAPSEQGSIDLQNEEGVFPTVLDDLQSGENNSISSPIESGECESSRRSPILVSKRTLNRAKNLLSCIDSKSDCPFNSSEHTSFAPPRRFLSPISNNLLYTSAQNNSEEKESSFPANISDFDGFKSAKGNPISVSDVSMDRAKTIMEDLGSGEKIKFPARRMRETVNYQVSDEHRMGELSPISSEIISKRTLTVNNEPSSICDSCTIFKFKNMGQKHEAHISQKRDTHSDPSINDNSVLNHTFFGDSNTNFEKPPQLSFIPQSQSQKLKTSSSQKKPPFFEEISAIFPNDHFTVIEDPKLVVEKSQKKKKHNISPSPSVSFHKQMDTSSSFRKRRGTTFSYPTTKKHRMKPFKSPKRVDFSITHSSNMLYNCEKAKGMPRNLPYQMDNFSFSNQFNLEKHTAAKLLAAPRGQRTNLGIYFVVEKFYTFSEDSLNSGLAPAIMSISLDSAKTFLFSSGDKEIGPRGMYMQLIGLGANPSHVTIKWVIHHYSMIVWKLACIVRSFWGIADPNWLSENITLEQLKWRYDTEYVLQKKSHLRLIMEGDERSSRYIVLCVAEIFHYNKNKSKSHNIAPISHILLTDGWYTIQAKLDSLLFDLLQSKKIFVGLKLRICGASLSDIQTFSPLNTLQDIDSSCQPPILSLNYNGTRRAVWDAKLGFQKKQFITMPLSRIKQNGGQIPSICVVIQRIYPPLVMVKDEDGSTLLYSEKEYTNLQKNLMNAQKMKLNDCIEKRRENRFKKADIYNFIQQKSLGLLTEEALEEEFLLNSSDPSSFLASLDSDTIDDLTARIQRCQEKEKGHISKEINEYSCRGGPSYKNGTPFLTIKVSDDPLNTTERKMFLRGSAFLTIWRPSDISFFSERQRLSIYNVSPYVPKKDTEKYGDGKSGENLEGEKDVMVREDGIHNMRNQYRFFEYKSSDHPGGPLSLTTLSRTRWNELPPSPLSFFQPRFCCSFRTVIGAKALLEFDAVGIILGASHPTVSSRRFRIQHIFVCDESAILTVIELKTSTIRFPFVGVPDRIVVMGFMNLEKYPGYMDFRLNAPVVSGCNRSFFSENVKDPHMLQRMNVVQMWVYKEGMSFVDQMKERVRLLILE